MIKLEVFGESAMMAAVARMLDEAMTSAASRSPARRSRGTRSSWQLSHPRAVDELLGDLRRLGVPEAQFTLMRVEVLGRSSGGTGEAGLVWEDVLGLAARNSRPIARYLAFIFAAGVIACFGVVLYSEILIVGAMAISPDLLPITAVGVGLVDRRLRLPAAPSQH